jgi:hypothetical protein
MPPIPNEGSHHTILILIILIGRMSSAATMTLDTTFLLLLFLLGGTVEIDTFRAFLDRLPTGCHPELDPLRYPHPMSLVNNILTLHPIVPNPPHHSYFLCFCVPVPSPKTIISSFLFSEFLTVGNDRRGLEDERRLILY